MLIAGAVCPHPPLLIPAALGSAASDPPAELRKVAAAAARAVAGLAEARPEVIVVVGGGAADRVLPLSLTVGRWLLERGGILDRDGTPADDAAVVFQEVARHAPAGDC